MRTIFVGVGNDTAFWNAIARKYPDLTRQASYEAGTRCHRKCGGRDCVNTAEKSFCDEGQLYQVIESPSAEQIKGNRVIGNLPVPLAALCAEYYQTSGEGDSVSLQRYAVMTYTNFVRGTGQDVFPTWNWSQTDD